MAEIIQRDGTWTFDGDTVRVVPGAKTHPVRQGLGELVIPVQALAGISFEPERRGGRLRLRLRTGACPVLRAADGRLKDAADPYQLAVEKDRTGVAEYFVDEVRNALVIEQVPDGPVDGFLLPGPSVPVSVGGGDGTASFDGESVRLTWNWRAENSKSSGGAVTFPVSGVRGVRWLPPIGLENGYLRFETDRSASAVPPKYDPYSLELWGLSKKEFTAVLVAAAVLMRLPGTEPASGPTSGPTSGPASGQVSGPASAHPALPGAPPGDAPGMPPTAPSAARPAAGPGVPPAGDHDVLLRRLRELGELHRSGVLTDNEFNAAKQAILKHL